MPKKRTKNTTPRRAIRKNAVPARQRRRTTPWRVVVSYAPRGDVGIDMFLDALLEHLATLRGLEPASSGFGFDSRDLEMIASSKRRALRFADEVRALAVTEGDPTVTLYPEEPMSAPTRRSVPAAPGQKRVRKPARSKRRP